MSSMEVLKAGEKNWDKHLFFLILLVNGVSSEYSVLKIFLRMVKVSSYTSTEANIFLLFIDFCYSQFFVIVKKKQ